MRLIDKQKTVYTGNFFNPNKKVTIDGHQIIVALLVGINILVLAGCQTSDQRQYQAQEVLLQQAAEGTWVMLKDPNGKEVKPVYIEPKIIVSPFKLNTN